MVGVFAQIAPLFMAFHKKVFHFNIKARAFNALLAN
jgi:hypothetical protein